VSANLNPLLETDKIANEISELLDFAKLFKKHLDFTLALLSTNSQEEVEALKEEFSEIKDFYEKVKTKEDLAVLPAKTALATFHDKLILELDDTLKKCFKKGRKGRMRLSNNPNNIALIRILVNFSFLSFHLLHINK